MFRQIIQQTIEKRSIATGGDRQMHIGHFTGGTAAGVDHHQPGAAGLHPLEQDWVCPGGIGTDQHYQLRLIKIFVVARHRIRPQRSLVGGYGR